jgi:hypothetical protein
LVIVRTIITIVPFITLFLLFTLLISAPAFDSSMCISGMDDFALVTVVSVASSAVLLLWSDATGRVPRKAFPVVVIMTRVFILLVIDYNRYHWYVQYRLEPLDMHVDLFIILGEMGVI